MCVFNSIAFKSWLKAKSAVAYITEILGVFGLWVLREE